MRIILSIMSLSVCYSTVISVPIDYNKIQDGINASSDGDTILVGTGTYIENVNFNGKEVSVLSYFC